ncbi:uncharacterized protein LOC103575483 isoform X2 [Microplitis demolitor]|uniref:uncharacterized protein LOC103575483 isoform X2 n=1 Tax=Microplitis demolitor TaxID=69319 RepID=UPI00235B602A|nr:uncharacterized protein LOC103575483 isoform X2 [Microplitis demolitor]
MKLFLSQIIFSIYLLIKITAGALNYQGFPKICHQIVQHSFQLFDHGHDYTQITECKFVNVEVDVHDFLHKDKLELKIFYHNKQIESLELHKTEGLLANGSTPVYVTKLISGINYTDINTNYVFKTLNIDKFVPEMGNFTLYHDKKKTASIIVFRKSHGFHVEGNIGNHVLRRLPHIYYLNTKYVYLKLRKKEQDNEWNNYVNKTDLSYDLQVPALNNVTINFFVILDSSSVSNMREEFMATLLMYYNYIDMFHGNLTSPKIRFSIKGIVIPSLNEYIPYLGNSRIGSLSLNISNVQKTIQKMVKVHNNLLNLNNHDIITVMSQRQLCDRDVGDETEDNCYVSSTYSDNICQESKYPNIIILVHADFQGFHGIFLEALSSMIL